MGEATSEGMLPRFRGRLPEGWNELDTWERFCVACNGDVEAAAEMLERSLAWRKTFVPGGVSSLLHYDFPEELAVREAFPQCFHKSDRLGRPVQYQLVGAADKEKLRLATTMQRILEWNVHRAEHTIRVKYPGCSKSAGRQVGQSVNVIDLAGFDLGNFTSEVRSYLKQYFQLLGANFPGNLAKVYLINTPLLFQPIWAIVRLFLPPRVRPPQPAHAPNRTASRWLVGWLVGWPASLAAACLPCP